MPLNDCICKSGYLMAISKRFNHQNLGKFDIVFAKMEISINDSLFSMAKHRNFVQKSKL